MRRTARSPLPITEAERRTTRTVVRNVPATLFLCMALWLCVRGPSAQAQEAGVDEWTAEHFQLAEQAQARNDLESAAQEYRAIIARDPKFAGALLNLGIVYHQQRKYRDAIKLLASAASLQPALLGAQLFLGID